MENAPVEGPFGLLDFIFSDLADEMTPVDFSTPANLDAFFNSDWAIQRPFIPGSYEADKDNPSNDALVQQAAVSTPAATSRVSTEQVISGAFTHGALDPTTSQALSRVPEFMSTKQSIYTCFHYLVHSAQAIPNSPLCHAILGWVYAYLARLSAGTASSRDEHYTAASEGIRALVTELTAPLLPELWRRTNTSERLSSYLSATFFVCQHDLMMENFSSFIKRIGEAKMVFQHHWADRTLPGPVESRIVIWLAFLELRFFFLGGERYASTDGQKVFMTILDEETKALPTLRRARTQKSVLSEMFPDNLPQEEDEEDLRKDRCRVQFDDFMCHLAKMRNFAAWDAMQAQRRDADSSLLKELREAKVEALHANLRRLQAECELVISSSKVLPSSDRPVDSITFHMLTVRALRSCAVIMFKRVTDTTSRTDAECQVAVADIVRIARLLRQSKYLRSPRSTIWPLPLYIAGIETTDGIYQDWILDYLKELGSWGAHMQLAAEGLQHTISLQEKTGFRAPLTYDSINL
ncbi:Fungal transcriptional regulatory protein [Cordyceps fumosorosea ARSEF 2679]|uniref:Fungal transcriptional regulatory protein n=1 Tax=Cordyceps fumosorosea (strain ARSEF 2679) TaxID=1081104 RepID=A0A167YH56_CORFA|nr:Fungal transcriptional regulatory protein [Cordyceps fumosorosea ARSEF 2679]OAA66319.1 Fungal transcriptional regulatory protein [Cordyceps fumosorosea ARSEF 2679]